MNANVVKQKIKNAVADVANVSSVILFGSRARGTARPESDWDILILLNKPKLNISDELQLMHKLYDVELTIEQPISTLIYTTGDWENKLFDTPLYRAVQKEGVVL